MVALQTVSADKYEGGAEVVTSLKVEEVAAGVRERVEVPLSFVLPEGAKPRRALLDLTVEGETDKWRVFVSDFSLTKVFKPLIQRDYGDEALSKFVFDVTPIMHKLLSDPVLRVVNEGSSPIKLLQTTLLIFYEYEGLGEYEYSYYVSLEKGKSFWGPLNPERSGMVYGVFKAFPTAELRVKVGDCEDKVTVNNVDEVGVECERAKSYFVDSEDEFVPLSLLVSSYNLKLPKLIIEEANYDGKALKVKLRNDGDDADEVLLLVYTLGTPLARKSLGPMKSGEEREEVVEVEVSKGTVGLNVRAIWIKAKLRGTVDKFVPV